MNQDDTDGGGTYTLDDLPNDCTNCGSWVDHWGEKMMVDCVRVGWDCDFCGTSDEWYMRSPTDSTLDFFSDSGRVR